jgi:hypothetical protein
VEVFDYTFSEDCRVDDTKLLTVTRESLDATNGYYRANKGRYFAETYGAVGRSRDLAYAHFWQPGDSTVETVLVINPFGTPIAPRHAATAMTRLVNGDLSPAEAKAVEPNDANKLLQARFFYDTMRQAQLTDESGKSLPLIVISSPSLDHHSTLSRSERKDVSRGDFTPFAYRALEVVHNSGYNRIHAAGYSLGTIAARAVQLAGRQDIDVLSGNYVGDAPHFKQRRPIRPLPLGILKPYMLDSMGTPYEGNWATANGLQPRKDGAERGESYSLRHWFGNGNQWVNLAIARGLSRDGFSDALNYMNKNRIPTSVSWSESKLMKGFETYINTQPDALELAGRGLLQLFRAKNAPHISGENPVYLTDVMVRSLLFAQSKNQ